MQGMREIWFVSVTSKAYIVGEVESLEFILTS